MAFALGELQQAIHDGRIEWRKHTLQRLAERHVLQKDVIAVLLSGEVIREYPDDRPFPSALVLGWIETRPLHVVVAHDATEGVVYVVTVYEPSLDVFQADFKTKKL